MNANSKSAILRFVLGLIELILSIGKKHVDKNAEGDF